MWPTIEHLSGQNILEGSKKIVGYVGLMNRAYLYNGEICRSREFVTNAMNGRLQDAGEFVMERDEFGIASRDGFALFGTADGATRACRVIWEKDGKLVPFKDVFLGTRKIEYTSIHRYV